MRPSLIASTIGLGSMLAVPAGMTARAAEGPSVRVVTPADLKWEPSPRAPGVLIAMLVGDPTKPERFIMRAKYPPGTVNGPHYHPTDEEITILSGTWYVGQGETMEPVAAIAMRPGTFILERAKNWHWTLTKSEPVEIEIHGIGPRANIYAR